MIVFAFRSPRGFRLSVLARQPKPSILSLAPIGLACPTGCICDCVVVCALDYCRAQSPGGPFSYMAELHDIRRGFRNGFRRVADPSGGSDGVGPTRRQLVRRKRPHGEIRACVISELLEQRRQVYAGRRGYFAVLRAHETPHEMREHVRWLSLARKMRLLLRLVGCITPASSRKNVC